MPKKPTREEKDAILEKYVNAYGCSWKEAEELYIFDTKYTDSDKDTKEYLTEHFGMEESDVADMFYKIPKLMNKKTVSKEVTARTRADQTSRADYIRSKIEQGYKFLFGEPTEITDNTLTYVAPETGLPITIKIAKHKTQKVVTKQVKRRNVAKDAEGNPVPTAASDTELRVMALENILRSNSELFPVLSVAGAQFGYVIQNAKYPFGSVRITHHKK